MAGEQRAIDVESRKKAIGSKRKTKRRVTVTTGILVRPRLMQACVLSLDSNTQSRHHSSSKLSTSRRCGAFQTGWRCADSTCSRCLCCIAAAASEIHIPGVQGVQRAREGGCRLSAHNHRRVRKRTHLAAHESTLRAGRSIEGCHDGTPQCAQKRPASGGAAPSQAACLCRDARLCQRHE